MDSPRPTSAHIPGLQSGHSSRFINFDPQPEPQASTSTSISTPSPPRTQTPFEALQNHASNLLRVIWDSGPACSYISAAVFAVNALMVKLLHNRVPSTEIILARSFISLVMCAYSAHSNDTPRFFGAVRNMHLLLSRGVFGAASMQCLYLSIFMLPLADAVTLFFFNPAMTTIAAWLMLREALSLLGACGVLVSLGGLLLLTQPPFIFGHGDAWDQQRTQGTIFGILSALLASGAFVSIRLIGSKEQPLVTSVWFHSVALVSCIIPLSVAYPSPAVWPSATETVVLLVVGVTSFWGQLTLSRGFQLQTAAKASAINLTQVVWSYAFGMLFLHDSLSWAGVGGSALIGAGAILVNIKLHIKLPWRRSASASSGASSGTGAAAATSKEAEAAAAAGQGRGGESEPLIGLVVLSTDAGEAAPPGKELAAAAAGQGAGGEAEPLLGLVVLSTDAAAPGKEQTASAAGPGAASAEAEPLIGLAVLSTDTADPGTNLPPTAFRTSPLSWTPAAPPGCPGISSGEPGAVSSGVELQSRGGGVLAGRLNSNSVAAAAQAGDSQGSMGDATPGAAAEGSGGPAGHRAA